MAVEYLEQIDDPRLVDYRQLKQSNLTRWSGKFIAEGDKVVERLLSSNWPIESIVLAARFEPQFAPRVPASIATYVLPDDAVPEWVGFKFHRGVLACGRRRAALTIDQIAALHPGAQLWVACPDVQSPDNLGGILRSAAALRATGVLLGRRCADPLSRRVLRVSMGTALVVPWIESKNLHDDLLQLQQRYGVALIATVLDDTAESLDQARFGERNCLLFGSEGHGLEPEWVQRCDRRITMPMPTGVDSLNVAVACGVFMYLVPRLR
jgi:tRNA G18 (ribose-2'-O)-methylase SpoU